MELNKDDRPISAEFTSARDVTLVAPDGSRCHIIEAGVPAMVHRSLFAVAIDKGLIPTDPKTLVAAPPPPIAPPPPQEVTVKAGLIDACKMLITRGNPDDFTIPGYPRAASAKKLVDFDFSTRDLHDAFAEAMHEVEQDGDDSTEHSEPVSESAE